MNITGIIAEYNPFHNGHAYHIQESRQLTGADYIIVVMSGDFVQRGEPAIIDKYARTKMALENGADLVIELPVRYATGSAEYFAKGSVGILNHLGCVTHLCFGSECGDVELIKEAASVLYAETPEYSSLLQDALRKGLTFPSAREHALFACGYTDHAALLHSPNNILGVEYCKVLHSCNSSIQPVTIMRKGASYHSTDTTLEICSATAIRTHITQEKNLLQSAVPINVFDILSSALNRTCPIIADDFSPMLHYQLLSAQTWQELTDYFDIPDNLAQRIFRLRYDFRSFDTFVDLIKTKNITELSVRRALTHILLKIQSHKNPTCYAHILGFQKKAAPLLKEIKEHADIPIITKPYEHQELLKEDIFSSQIYHSILTNKYDAVPYDELRQSMIVI